MDVEITPGRHLIRQCCYPAGIRLPKLPDPWRTTSSTGWTPYHGEANWEPGKEWDFRTHAWVWPHQRLANSGSSATRTRVALVVIKDGNLPRAHYAQWRGVEFKSAPFSECRYCGQACFSERDRLAHGEVVEGDQHYSHAKLCQFTAKLLLGRKECVACGAPCKGAKWGVPLCLRQRCYDDWQFKPAKFLKHWVDAVRFIDADLRAPIAERMFVK